MSNLDMAYDDKCGIAVDMKLVHRVCGAATHIWPCNGAME